MSRTRIAALAVFGARIAYAAGLALAPSKVGTPWIGPSAASAPTQVPLRLIAGREVVLHAVAAADVLRGRDVVPWLLVSLAGDLGDIASTVASRAALPSGNTAKTAVAAGTSGALTAAVLAGALRAR
jgi:hypothetical protein